jgi:hypothetical protein
VRGGKFVPSLLGGLVFGQGLGQVRRGFDDSGRRVRLEDDLDPVAGLDLGLVADWLGYDQEMVAVGLRSPSP